MGEDYTNKTKATLGKVIKKPPLTDKLLSKPPFRFLHDIITEVIRTSGFLKGLYQGDEMNAQNVKDKDSKMAFLQKSIDVVAMVSGESLAVRTSKVVAGHEPEKTNEFLQALGKCILKKLSSEDEVARVLRGEKPGSDTKSKPKKEERERENSAEKKRRSNKEESEKKHSAGKEKEEREKRSSKERRKDRENQERDRDRSKDRERSRDKNREREREEEKREQEQKRRRREEEEEEDNQNLEIPANDEGEDMSPTFGQNEEIQPNRIPRPLSAKGVRRGPPKDLEDSDSDTDDPEVRRSSARGGRAPPPQPDEMNGVLNGEDDLPPQVQVSRRMARPSSARPPAPRVKGQDLADEPATRIGSGKRVANVIVDDGQSDEDEDGGGFFMEEAQQGGDAQQQEMEPDDLMDSEEHGGLVNRILQSKKEFQGASRNTHTHEKPQMMDAARRKEREMVSRDIERLRSSVQTLCRSANPLGKTLDYVQEDMDSMQKELQMWRKENKEHALAIAREQSVTESELEPLRAQLAELDQAISDQLDLISAVKHNILKNDEKVQKMIGSIAYSAR